MADSCETMADLQRGEDGPGFYWVGSNVIPMSGEQKSRNHILVTLFLHGRCSFLCYDVSLGGIVSLI